MKRKHIYFALGKTGRVTGKVTQNDGIPLQGSVEHWGTQVSVFLADSQGRTIWRKNFHPAEGDNGGRYRYDDYEVSVRVDIRDQTVDIGITR